MNDTFKQEVLTMLEKKGKEETIYHYEIEYYKKKLITRTQLKEVYNLVALNNRSHQ